MNFTQQQQDQCQTIQTSTIKPRVFLLYIMSGLSLHGINVASGSASKLSYYSVLPLADIQQDQDNGQTCHTDNSCLCTPTKPLMCSGHVSRVHKAIRTLPGWQIPAPTYAQLTKQGARGACMPDVLSAHSIGGEPRCRAHSNASAMTRNEQCWSVD